MERQRDRRRERFINSFYKSSRVLITKSDKDNCYGLNCVPPVPNSYVEALNPTPLHVTLFGNKVVKEEVKLVWFPSPI